MPIILLTGAGASAPLGYPTTTTFFGSPPENPGWTNDTWNLFLDLFVGEKGLLGTDTTVDVENVLQFLDDSATLFEGHAGAFVKKHAGASWAQLLSQIKTLILHRCFSVYGKQISFDDVARLYQPLLDLLDCHRRPVSLFTTNYDPVPDKLMAWAVKKGLPAYDGFDGRLHWNPRGYDDLDRGLGIYRLHGALSWIHEGNRVKNTRIYDRVPRTLIEYVLIYPGSRENPEDEAEAVFPFLHQAFKRKLSQATLLLVIGFSFRDPCLNKVLESSLRENKKLNLFLVLPHLPSGPDVGLQSLMSAFQPRIEHFAVHFGDPRNHEGEKTLRSLYEALGRFVE